MSRRFGGSGGVERRYDWVFFDAGETLFRVGDPEPEYAAVLAELGYRVTPEQMLSAFKQARSQAFALDHLGPGPEYAILRPQAEARRERFIGALVRAIGVHADRLDAAREVIHQSLVSTAIFGMYAEVPATLAALHHHGYQLGIISNWEPRLEQLCRNHGLGEFFSFVLASEAEGFAKPGPRLFRRALELAGVEPASAVHVGDSFEHDVLGATAVGIDAVLLDRGGYYGPGRWQPTIRSLDELPKVIGTAAAEVPR